MCLCLKLPMKLLLLSSLLKGRLHYSATAATIAAPTAAGAAGTAAAAIILGRRRWRWWLHDDCRLPCRWRHLYHLYTTCVVLHIALTDFSRSHTTSSTAVARRTIRVILCVMPDRSIIAYILPISCALHSYLPYQ